LISDDPPRVQRRRKSGSTDPASTASNTPSETLLFVEPDVLVRAPVAEYLRECGYRVIEANSIEAAQEILSTADSRVDVVFAEVSHLGTAEGFAFAKTIRDRYPGIDVILTSSISHCASKAGDLCEEEAMLGKPYHSDELLRRIQILREKRRSSKPR
jgi:DNA-binding response OmpR family regulator